MKSYQGKRIGNRVQVTVVDDVTGTKHVLRHVPKHSPDGFDWGYAGSGPSDLARCILIEHFGGGVLAIERTDGLYMKFKFDFVAEAHKEVFVITEAEIDKWLEIGDS